MSVWFAGSWNPWWVAALALILGASAWQLYRRELKDTSAPWNWLLPCLRCSVVAMLSLTFAEPILRVRSQEGQPGAIIFAIDHSRSMSLGDAQDSGTSDSDRFERALELLLGIGAPSSAVGTGRSNTNAASGGICSQLVDTFHLSIQAINSADNMPILWDSRLVQSVPPPRQLQPLDEWGDSTELGDSLSQLVDSQRLLRSAAPSVLVLLSDGQNNAGSTPADVAERLSASNIRLFTVGLGRRTTTDDLRLLAGQVPLRVYMDDALSGRLNIAEHIPAGANYSAEIRYAGETVWQQDMVSKQELDRDLNFSFPVQKVVQIAREKAASGVEFTSLPVKLDVQVHFDGDTNPFNDQLSFYTSITIQPAKILLIDGRSRWETRYLKNLFSRDPSWKIKACIADPTWSLTSAQQLGLPGSRAELFEYNLVILGDIDPAMLDTTFLEWLNEFVAVRGGGLILIDGQREHLRSEGYRPLQDLVPVRWLELASRLPGRPKLTPSGERVEALKLPATADQLVEWKTLPELEFVSHVEKKIGAEVLAVAESAVGETPLIIHRQFGAGHVLFLASDQTWKWRYQKADQLHGPFWNQLARWVMARPLSTQAEFASLDSGQPSYQVGETVEILSQLRDDSGQPKSNHGATAVIYHDNQVVSRLMMTEDEQLPGSYRCTVADLPPGDYRVRLESAGFPQRALDMESTFSILDERSDRELQQIVCNESLLRNLADQTGGRYVHEEEIVQLVPWLRPLSTGRFETKRTPIWQTYWWFTAALSLLIVEWIFRKRAGMV